MEKRKCPKLRGFEINNKIFRNEIYQLRIMRFTFIGPTDPTDVGANCSFAIINQLI